jgi:uncharacterized protein (DUF2252 family)
LPDTRSTPLATKTRHGGHLRTTIQVLLVLFLGLGSSAQAQSRIDRVLADADALPAPARQAKLAGISESPFRFFRGTASLFWGDLARDGRLRRFGGTPDTETWLLGDAHPENVGTFGDERVLYDVNDFDESVIADYQLDLWRMAAGVVLAARENGSSRRSQRHAVKALARGYADALSTCAGSDREHRPRRPERDLRGDLRDLAREVKRKRTRKRMLRKWTAHDPLGARVLDTAADTLEAVPAGVVVDLTQSIAAYAQRRPIPSMSFTVKSVARRLGAGTGSLGVDRYYVLVEGPSWDDDDDWILDVKIQAEPAPWAFLPPAARALQAGHSGARVASAERALLGVRADPTAGWLDFRGSSCSVRSRSPRKDSLELSELRSRSNLRETANAWGRILATAHARADSSALISHSFDDAAHARIRYEGEAFRELVWQVAREVADQVEADHRDLVAALAARQP